MVCKAIISLSCVRRRLTRAPQELLTLGNEVNRHRGAPPAAGFKLSSLNKFAELRSWDTQWSLLEVGANLVAC